MLRISNLSKDQKKKIDSFRKQIEALDPRKVKSVEAALSMIQTAQKLETSVKKEKKAVTAFQRDTRRTVVKEVKTVASLKGDLKDDIEHLKKKSLRHLNDRQVANFYSHFSPGDLI